ncbi:MAG: Two-component transcriptional response regulator, LuxR family [Nitrospira sp.]|jgi:DNA-binding NarL/FixJ family response regulator|nr:MAG: Two-component transcriptional response regulator, LuxR family [Nitrospira sp.]
MFKILIADDFPVLRAGVKELVSRVMPVTIGEAADIPEMLRLIRTQTWDTLVLDINMPGGSSIDALREVKRDYPKLPILVLSMYPEEQYALRMFKAGANGYLTKTAIPAELVQAIKKVLGGGNYVTPLIGEQLAVAYGFPSTHRDQLSNRELEVLRLIASGKTCTEIAAELSLSATTIITYRARILEKLHLRNNMELTRYALEQKLIF